MKFQFNTLVATLFFCIPFLCGAQETDTTNNRIYSIKVDTLNRTYIVHLPKNYNREKAYPLVLVFHGGGSNAKQWMPYCGMNETADKNDFIVVYPNGTGKTIEGYGDIFGWNGGTHIPGGINSSVAKVNDVGFINTLLDTLEKQYTIDTNRIYAAGMSMGAMMVFRLASELSNRIAAIAPISGPMATESCTPQRPVSIIYFHGTEDPAVPFNGGKGKIDQTGTVYYSVDYSLACWLKANGCIANVAVKQLKDKANDGTFVTRKTYHCKNNSEVVFYEIKGGGHTWPGRDFGPELKILGTSTKNIYANDIIWDFFKKHPKK
ncbi:MAG: PHB depolymerase family esterase [Siphonobacter sp.]